jgi:hypothetical protein
MIPATIAHAQNTGGTRGRAFYTSWEHSNSALARCAFRECWMYCVQQQNFLSLPPISIQHKQWI